MEGGSRSRWIPIHFTEDELRRVKVLCEYRSDMGWLYDLCDEALNNQEDEDENGEDTEVRDQTGEGESSYATARAAIDWAKGLIHR